MKVQNNNDQPLNPDDLLSDARIAMKYQRNFAKYFLPKHIYSLQDAWREFSDHPGNEHDLIKVIGRVRPAHNSTKGKTQDFEVKMSKFRVWRKNIKLYNFIAWHICILLLYFCKVKLNNILET